MHNELPSPVVEFLSRLGCGETETRIYVELVRTGASSIQELSIQLELKRVTVHSAVERLRGRCLVFETILKKRRRIVAESPEILAKLVSREIASLKQLGEQAQLAIAELSTLKHENQVRPSIRFYETKEGFKQMLELTLAAKNEVLVFIHVDKFVELVGQRYLFDYYTRRADRGIRTRLIFPKTKLSKDISQRALRWKMTIRTIDDNTPWRSGIFCWNNSVALLSFSRGRVTCTVIENEDISDFYRRIIFELNWLGATQLKFPIGPGNSLSDFID